MKYIEEFRNGKLARAIAKKIYAVTNKNRYYKLMEFCGGHTHAIHRYGLPSLLPPNVEMIHGPGCPVCVLPISRVDQAISLAKLSDVIFCSYGDMLRVPATNQNNLLKAKACGADVRIVYSIDDALQIARHNPLKHVIFFAIGFETTTPPTAVALKYAKQQKLKNFTIFCNHVLTAPALASILATREGEAPIDIDGFIGPAHVSIIIGSNAYQKISRTYQKPIVISGFEPLDLLYSILMLLNQINDSRYVVENQYTRAVDPYGNIISQSVMSEVFSVRHEFEWRGLGSIPFSALKINDNYADFDAEKRFETEFFTGKEHKACECGAILRGRKKPLDCKLFGKVCTPENPLGSCMVSSEGACAAYYAYSRV